MKLLSNKNLSSISRIESWFGTNEAFIDTVARCCRSMSKQRTLYRKDKGNGCRYSAWHC